ncbi:LuxR family transcriptional regulator [Streptomyces sp. NPDC091272]|uniref:LuxR family transcriptional regulator n=1 Tax=Streptomyces sp. NPDC091272 TaxID=3365981 RepID=UPI0038260773
MEINALGPLADELLDKASQAHSGRSGKTVYGGHGSSLGQTLIALTAGTTLSDHENPGEATVLVVRGHVRLTVQDRAWDGVPYDVLPVPDAIHGLEAVEDSVILLTVARQI